MDILFSVIYYNIFGAGSQWENEKENYLIFNKNKVIDFYLVLFYTNTFHTFAASSRGGGRLKYASPNDEQ